MKTAFNPSDGSFGPLTSYVNPYLAHVKAQDFAAVSLRRQLHVLRFCGHWMKQTGREVHDLDEAAMFRCLQLVSRYGYGRNSGASTLRRLLALFRTLGVTPPATPPRQTSLERIVGEYERFLLNERNLALGSLDHARLTARRFLTETFGDGPLTFSRLRAPDVTTFIQRHAHDHGPFTARHLVRGIRSVLRYLYYKGLIDTDLSLAVPTVASWRLSTLPKHLPAAEVRQLLRHCDRKTALGRRNYAILLLLARLGLRAGEVIKLRLEDVDWENARLTICGKGDKWAQLPLPADVAKAIANYLCHDRPRCSCRQLFLRNYAPIGGFRRAGAMSSMVKRALQIAGIVSGRNGAHLLRHSLATDMLRKGASLAEIGEVLRHRSVDTTAIYAKVDLTSLRALALPWPGGAR